MEEGTQHQQPSFKIPKRAKLETPKIEIPVGYQLTNATKDEHNQIIAQLSKKPFVSSVCDEVWKSVAPSIIQLIKNPRLNQKFDEYKERIGSNEEFFGYRLVYDQEEAVTIARDGIKIGCDLFGDIGDPSKGVLMYNSAAVANGGNVVFKNKPVMMVMFRTVRGKTNEVRIGSGSLEPSQKHNCHLPYAQRAGDNRTDLPIMTKERRLGAVYHYEYSPDLSNVQTYPSMLLPYAVIKFDRQDKQKLGGKIVLSVPSEFKLNLHGIHVFNVDRRLFKSRLYSTFQFKTVPQVLFRKKGSAVVLSAKDITSCPPLAILRNSNPGKLLSSESVFLEGPQLATWVASHFVLRLDEVFSDMDERDEDIKIKTQAEVRNDIETLKIFQKLSYFLLWEYKPFTVCYIPSGPLASELGLPNFPNYLHVIVFRDTVNACTRYSMFIGAEMSSSLCWTSAHDLLKITSNDHKFKESVALNSDTVDKETTPEVPVSISVPQTYFRNPDVKGILRAPGKVGSKKSLRFREILADVKEFSSEVHLQPQNKPMSFQEQRKKEEQKSMEDRKKAVEDNEAFRAALQKNKTVRKESEEREANERGLAQGTLLNSNPSVPNNRPPNFSEFRINHPPISPLFHPPGMNGPPMPVPPPNFNIPPPSILPIRYGIPLRGNVPSDPTFFPPTNVEVPLPNFNIPPPIIISPHQTNFSKLPPVVQSRMEEEQGEADMDMDTSIEETNVVEEKTGNKEMELEEEEPKEENEILKFALQQTPIEERASSSVSVDNFLDSLAAKDTFLKLILSKSTSKTEVSGSSTAEEKEPGVSDTDMKTSHVTFSLNKPKPSATKCTNVLADDDDDEDVATGSSVNDVHDVDYRMNQKITPKIEHLKAADGRRKDRDDRVKDIDERVMDIPLPKTPNGNDNLKKMSNQLQEKLRANNKKVDQAIAEGQTSESSLSSSLSFPTVLNSTTPGSFSTFNLHGLANFRVSAEGLIPNQKKQQEVAAHSSNQPQRRSPSPEAPAEPDEPNYVSQSFINQQKCVIVPTEPKEGYEMFRGVSSISTKEVSPKKQLRDFDSIKEKTSDKKATENWSKILEARSKKTSGKEDGEISEEEKSKAGSSGSFDSNLSIHEEASPPGIVRKIYNAPNTSCYTPFPQQPPQEQYFSRNYRHQSSMGRTSNQYPYNGPVHMVPNNRGRGGIHLNGRGGHNGNGNGVSWNSNYLGSIVPPVDRTTRLFTVLVDFSSDVTPFELDELFKELTRLRKREGEPKIHATVFVHSSSISDINDPENEEMFKFCHVLQNCRSEHNRLVEILTEHDCDSTTVAKLKSLAKCISDINRKRGGRTAIFVTNPRRIDPQDTQAFKELSVELMSVSQAKRFFEDEAALNCI